MTRAAGGSGLRSPRPPWSSRAWSRTSPAPAPTGWIPRRCRDARLSKPPTVKQLTGDCIAQHAGEHAMSTSPLADYAIGGRDGTGGIAGIIGVLVTVAVAGSAFWLISPGAGVSGGRRRPPALSPRRFGRAPRTRRGEDRLPGGVRVGGGRHATRDVLAVRGVRGDRRVVWRLARIPVRWILPRMLIEAPFLVLAVLLPFAEGGPRIEVVGLQLSVTGLYAAWGIVVKGTLGRRRRTDRRGDHVVARTARSAEQAAASRRRDVGAGVDDPLRRRAAPPRRAGCGWRGSRVAIRRAHVHQAGAIAKGIGALFLRSYERGERVYLAMLSRGFDGNGTRPGGDRRAAHGQP